MPPETAAIAPKGIRKLGKVDLDWARKAPLNAIIGAAFVANFFNNAAISFFFSSSGPPFLDFAVAAVLR